MMGEARLQVELAPRRLVLDESRHDIDRSFQSRNPALPASCICNGPFVITPFEIATPDGEAAMSAVRHAAE